jgi:hypothetical protein
MLLRLAGKLDVPPRESNELLIAAGYAPRYGALAYDAPELDPVNRAIDRLLEAHEPYPAVVVDRQWELVAANEGVGLLTDGVAPELLEPPVNALRLALHPDGVARRILNLAEWRGHILERLERQARLSGDPALGVLLTELRGYPGGETHDPREHDVFVPLRLAGPDGAELNFLSTVATFGTAVDVTVAELSIESFFPADEATAAALPAR